MFESSLSVSIVPKFSILDLCGDLHYASEKFRFKSSFFNNIFCSFTRNKVLQMRLTTILDRLCRNILKCTSFVYSATVLTPWSISEDSFILTNSLTLLTWFHILCKNWKNSLRLTAFPIVNFQINIAYEKQMF